MIPMFHVKHREYKMACPSDGGSRKRWIFGFDAQIEEK